MKCLVFGSMNIDKVYSLEHLPERGETLSCGRYEVHVGGKGLNQAVSLAKSGADVYMAGYVGTDGALLTEYLDKSGVDTGFVRVTDSFSGHAVIEVDGEGQNQMVLFPGANREITKEYCDEIIEKFSPGDLLVMQYETSQVEYMIARAHDKGMKVALNPSPFVEALKNIEYEKIDYLILNESEGCSLSEKNGIPEVINALTDRVKNGAVVLTLGADGAVYADSETVLTVPAFKAEAVDTTGAGDTFTGYFLNAVLCGENPEKALKTACAASALAVMKPGAAETIPEKEDVYAFLEKHKT